MIYVYKKKKKKKTSKFESSKFNVTEKNKGHFEYLYL